MSATTPAEREAYEARTMDVIFGELAGRLRLLPQVSVTLSEPLYIHIKIEALSRHLVICPTSREILDPEEAAELKLFLMLELLDGGKTREISDKRGSRMAAYAASYIAEALVTMDDYAEDEA
jgi:hypothetical protein